MSDVLMFDFYTEIMLTDFELMTAALVLVVVMSGIMEVLNER